MRMITSANADMLFHYWKVGHFILYLQKKEGWGNKVIDNLSKAIRSKYPDKKGYSRRNIFYMCQFASAYPLEVLKEMDRIDSLLTTPTLENVLSLTNELNQRGCVKIDTSSFLFFLYLVYDINSLFTAAMLLISYKMIYWALNSLYKLV